MITKFEKFNENTIYNDFQDTHERIAEIIKTDLTFLPRYELQLTTIYPIIEKLYKDLPKTKIILLTLYAFSRLLYENKYNYHRIEVKLEEYGLKDKQEEIIKLMKNLYKLFNIHMKKKNLNVLSFKEMMESDEFLKYFNNFLKINDFDLNYLLNIEKDLQLKYLKLT